MIGLRADWPAPACVQAGVTTREGGVSTGPWRSLNLAEHVGDDPVAVSRNRARLAEYLPGPVTWLRQVHGTACHRLPAASPVTADAAFTREPGVVCAVLTADCLPVFFCEADGRAVAVAHAGWRGLAAGVLEATLRCFPDPARVLCWLGPAIGPDAFEVGEEVRTAFVEGPGDPAALTAAFHSVAEGRYTADLYALARIRLRASGVTAVSGGGFCTYRERERFYSYRRDGQTGRMASLIWRD